MACIFRNILLKALPVAALALNLAACETSRPAANIEARTEAVFASIEQTRRAHELEEQIVARLDASPFEVGPLGSALLDLDSDNLVAHLGLAVFYDAVKEPRSAARHRLMAEDLAAGIEKIGTSFVVASPAQAESLLRTQGYTCIGARYLPSAPLAYQILAVDEAGVNHDFDFLLARPEHLAPPGLKINFSKFEDILFLLMPERSRLGDTAARAFIRQVQFEHSDTGFGLPEWFTSLPAGRPNVNIDLLKGYEQQNAAVPASGEARLEALHAAKRHYARAARAGSTEAMYLLARLYRSKELGRGNQEKAAELFRKAAEAKNLNATRELARFLERGDAVFDESLESARDFYRNAYALGGKGDLRAYIEFLRRHEDAVEFDKEALDALRASAKDKHAWSLMTLANLYADGVGVKANYRRARALMRDAAREAPEAPDLINEVAWVLATSNKRQLRDDRFALAVMDQMMRGNEDAQANPMYLDTWAAAYAANGDFEEAVRLQNRALEAADESPLGEDLVAEMQTHLAHFHKGEALSKENFDADEDEG
ncbi:MAG: tetratricopeptide repeat protein [Gammaproteobacteria bacterium]|nr:tetratricopeptide repeat protein [Gammaproteobacteria bacterium]